MKKWYTSKTLWANVGAGVSLFISRQYGIQIPPDAAGELLALLNIILRFFTKEGLTK